MVNLRTKRALKRARLKTPAELLEAGGKNKGRKVNKPAQKRKTIRRRLK